MRIHDSERVLFFGFFDAVEVIDEPVFGHVCAVSAVVCVRVEVRAMVWRPCDEPVVSFPDLVGERDEFLEGLGLKVFHTTDYDVLQHVDLVLWDLRDFIVNNYVHVDSR